MADKDLKDKWLKQRGGKMNLSLLLNSSSCLTDRVDDSGAERLLTPPKGKAPLGCFPRKLLAIVPAPGRLTF